MNTVQDMSHLSGTVQKLTVQNYLNQINKFYF